MTNRLTLEDRFCGSLVGLAVADAVGTTLEFQPRGSFEPLVDLVGGGPFNLPAGAWTDDTSMALCLATSLIKKDGFDPVDQMNRYVNWMRYGYLSSIGHCFDIGNTTASALNRYLVSGDPFSGSNDPMSAGNGSIMRLAPIAMFFYGDEKKITHFSAESSRTTHAARECLDACSLFGRMLNNALVGASKEKILSVEMQFESEKIREIAAGSWRTKTLNAIRGSGYVVESLEAALWCFEQTTSFRDAVLMAANLGDDADTTAAVTGQIAGAHYGMSGIPDAWLMKLVMRDEIVALAARLLPSARG